MNILTRRLLVIAIGGLAGATAVGLLATSAATFILGILTLGGGMILSILFYLLRPVPAVQTFESPDWSIVRESVPVRTAQKTAEVISFQKRT